jgi:hypothetical protein
MRSTAPQSDDEVGLGDLLRPRTPEALVASLILLMFVVLAAFSPAQNDTWWHLAAGRRMAATGSVELVDHFSWTARGHYWPNHQWLGQLLLFEEYRVGGMASVALAGALLLATTLAFVWRSMRGPPLFRGLLLLCLAPMLVSEWSLRPKLFTLSALSLTLWLLQRRRYVWLPPLFLLWANLHGGVAVGILALSAACLEALVHDRKRVPRLALATACSVLASACTPLGLSFFPDVLLSPARPDFRYITEWQPVGKEPWTFAVVAFVALLGGLTLRFRSTLDERERVLAYVAAALLPLALLVSRNIPIFTLAAGPLLSTLLLRVPGTHRLFRSGRPRNRPYSGPLLAGSAVALVTVAVVWQTRAPFLGWAPISPAAAAAIRACGRPIYNHYDNGGPLIWFLPEQPVFIDSRQHPYPASFVVEHFEVEDSGAYEPLFERQGIRCAVLPPYSKVAHAIVRDGWRVTYRDTAWVVAVPK